MTDTSLSQPLKEFIYIIPTPTAGIYSGTRCLVMSRCGIGKNPQSRDGINRAAVLHWRRGTLKQWQRRLGYRCCCDRGFGFRILEIISSAIYSRVFSFAAYFSPGRLSITDLNMFGKSLS